MANRAQRRAIMRSQTKKDKALIQEYTMQQRIAGLIQNGITIKDLEENFERGREIGFNQAGWPIIKSCMAGACLMMKETFGMSEDDIIRGLKALHEKIAWALEYSELAEEVLEKTGIELQMDDPLEPVRRI